MSYLILSMIYAFAGKDLTGKRVRDEDMTSEDDERARMSLCNCNKRDHTNKKR